MRETGTMRRYPWSDLAVAAIVAALSAVSLLGRSDVVAPTVRDWVSIPVLAAPLIWRRRAPVTVFWVGAALGALTSWAGADSAAQLFVPLVAIYTIARHCPRRKLWLALAGIGASLLSGLIFG